MGALKGEVAARIEAIRSDYVHGASFLAKEALKTLGLAAEAYGNGEGLMAHLREVGQALARTKPAMGAIKNVVHRFLRELENQGGGRGRAVSLAQELTAHLERLSEETARNAARLIQERSVLLTCSYSSGVVRALRQAWEWGKGFRVRVLESRCGDVRHGLRVAQELGAWGIPVEVFPDPSLKEALRGTGQVLVGADKVLPDGSLINGVPTLEVAREAQGRVPVYTLCESFKLDREGKPEEGFDLVPGPLITGIISEEGVFPPERVKEILGRSPWQGGG